jgi:hypothetical protein
MALVAVGLFLLKSPPWLSEHSPDKFNTEGMLMPVVFRYKGFRFFFYSNEGNPREPTHIHVRSGEGEAKFWLYPTVHLAESSGFDAGALRELASVVAQNLELIEGTWNAYFA